MLGAARTSLLVIRGWGCLLMGWRWQWPLMHAVASSDKREAGRELMAPRVQGSAHPHLPQSLPLGPDVVTVRPPFTLVRGWAHEPDPLNTAKPKHR